VVMTMEVVTREREREREMMEVREMTGNWR
jgi:hypothetical protein